MALPYENMTADARAQQRQDRLRRREVWPKDTQEKRHHYEIGSHVATAWELFEDAVVELSRLQGDGREPVLAMLRRGAGVCKKAYKRTEMAAKLGLDAVDKVYDRTADLEDLDEEEAKLVKEFMKESAKQAGSGKAQKKYEHGYKPYETDKEKAVRGSAPAAGPPGNWSMFPQLQFGMGGGYGSGQGSGPVVSWQNVPMMLANMMGSGMMPAGGMAAQEPLQTSSSGGYFSGGQYSAGGGQSGSGGQQIQ